MSARRLGLEAEIARYVHGGKFKTLDKLYLDLDTSAGTAKRAIDRLITLGSIQRQRSYIGHERTVLVPMAHIDNITSRTNESIVAQLVSQLDDISSTLAKTRLALRELERRIGE